MLPKLTVDGLAPSVPDAVPVPDNGKLAVALLLLKAMFPVTLPALWGAKETENAALCPGLSVMGNARPLIAKPDPVGVALLMVRLLPPEFVRVAG